MRKPCIPELIYQKIFPKPKQGEAPASFYAFIQRHIVPEVRVEVQNYYGALDSLESQYPGLDYNFAPHRRRLSRYQWHRRLFRAMNDLGLTDNEVLNLCQWEGTRAAKERYEREARVQVRTTTADEIGAAPVGNGPRATFEDISRPASAGTASSSNETLVAVSQRDDTSSKDAELLPVPEDFIGLLRHAMQSRLQGDHAHINQAWEAWLKETLENHDEIDIDSVMTAIQNLEPETFGIDQQGGDGEVETPRSPTPQSPAAETYQEVTPIDQTQIDRFRRAGAHLLPRSQAETAR